MDVKIAKLEQRVTQLEADAKEFHKILEPIKVNNIRNDEHYKYITETLNEIKEDVKELKNRPSKFLDYIYMTLISLGIAFLFKLFGG